MNDLKVVDDYYFFTDHEGNPRMYGTVVKDDRYDLRSHEYAPGHHIITSRIKKLKSRNGTTLLYTENSVYKLLHPRSSKDRYDHHG